ncbi:NAD(P)H-dependent oxidoreductase [Bifidobacterium sp.]|jgi:NAD(P)H dehydrogenase (quinone)|uniref:NAD(P)H-dependent oxidoreductase n=1 Tax=Bifidobacterium sp. TaxID=41200 RepID=UPI0025B9917E|nr:NAD(P)H-dependent oxidoreductase [Bifidobacterium sp.]MCH4209625.1 NAD(P)H-dependent oxidoreductase [Bifidobacterium sp.]MCI1224848.1 NAD(P)H-dependent oxidoreductase [Bifidobacterium sp.]
MSNVLVITSNPESTSLTDAVGEAFASGAREAGAQAEVLDLHKIGFDPVYGAADREHYLGRVPVPDDVVPIQNRLAGSDVIALVFPVYWYTMPAMMKGFFDRVICRGFAYDAATGKPLALAGKTVRVIALTGGSRQWYESDGIDAALRNQICVQTFKKYCGVEDVDLVYVDNLTMGDHDHDKRAAAGLQLGRIKELGASLV